jgi:hypothetical protein
MPWLKIALPDPRLTQSLQDFQGIQRGPDIMHPQYGRATLCCQQGGSN